MPSAPTAHSWLLIAAAGAVAVLIGLVLTRVLVDVFRRSRQDE